MLMCLLFVALVAAAKTSCNMAGQCVVSQRDANVCVHSTDIEATSDTLRIEYFLCTINATAGLDDDALSNACAQSTAINSPSKTITLTSTPTVLSDGVVDVAGDVTLASAVEANGTALVTWRRTDRVCCSKTDAVCDAKPLVALNRSLASAGALAATPILLGADCSRAVADKPVFQVLFVRLLAAAPAATTTAAAATTTAASAGTSPCICDRCCPPAAKCQAGCRHPKEANICSLLGLGGGSSDTATLALTPWLHAVGASVAAAQAVLAAAERRDVSVAVDEAASAPTLVDSANAVVAQGLANVLRHLARAAPPALHLYDGEAARLAVIDTWLNVAERLSSAGQDEDALASAASELNAHLTLRTFVASGVEPSVGDVALWHAVRGAVAGGGVEAVDAALAKLKFMHVRRWFGHCGSLAVVRAGSDEGEAATASANAPGKKQRVVTKAGVMGSFDKIDVAGASIVTRFPPEPSGYLHIGHVKAAMLNNEYARKKPGGRLHCRFDDTNPEKEKAEFEDAILGDLASINIFPDTVSHTSDFFPRFVEFCEKFIRDGNAYVDFTPMEQMREQRGAGVASACRSHSVEENLRLWGEMINATPLGLTCVVRAKIDLRHSNTAMRDPALYRCKLTPHYRTGTKFKVYPMYDFACPIIDSLEGVTHALRSSEYTSRNPLYVWVAEKAGLRVPKIEDFSRLNFEYVLLSKRKLQKLVETGVVGGWDDPRFPTIRGILRRGMEPSVLREFILAQGASKNSVCMTMDKLWVLNKDVLDKVVHRHVALPAADIVPLTLAAGDGVPAGIDVRPVEKHPKRPEFGSFPSVYTSTLWLAAADAAPLAVGEELTLLKWGNIVVTAIERDAAGRAVAIAARFNAAGDPRATKHKISWLPRVGDGVPGRDQGHLVDVLLQEFGYLITVKTVDDDQDFDTVVNKNSMLETRAFGAPSMRALAAGDKIQIMRNGYYRVDKAATATTPLVLIKIPDGSHGPLSPPADAAN